MLLFLNLKYFGTRFLVNHVTQTPRTKMKGIPKGFVFPVREVRASVGAGFIVPIGGNMMTMPGLPAIPVFMKIDIDIDEDGRTVGLS
jgi:formyltetrahydrofolate synthetase